LAVNTTYVALHNAWFLAMIGEEPAGRAANERACSRGVISTCIKLTASRADNQLQRTTHFVQEPAL
jgi:hypothetical protein